MVAAPKSQEWNAIENRQPPHGETVPLKVTGKVATTNANQMPYLAEAVPQGINKKILILNLTITSSGSGATVLGEKDVGFEKKVTPGQHTSVDIHWEGQSIAQRDVKVVV